MKRLFLIFITIILLVSFTVPVGADSSNEVKETTFSEAYIPSEVQTLNVEIVYLEELSLEELTNLMNQQKAKMNSIHHQANAFRMIGYSDYSKEIQNLQSQWHLYNSIYMNYKSIYDKVLIEQKMHEYPVAGYVWKYLKNLGYNDAVCAGIIGNMMLECAGGTLDLQWDIYGGYGFYGLCQWSKEFYPEAFGADLDGQLECLKNSIKEQIDYAGFVYGGYGFGYEDFLKITDPGEAALCFALAYERCAYQHIWPRKGYAKIAYDYFTN